MTFFHAGRGAGAAVVGVAVVEDAHHEDRRLKLTAVNRGSAQPQKHRIAATMCFGHIVSVPARVRCWKLRLTHWQPHITRR